MKFSIVTISFNQGNYIEETINSVLNQRGVDLEYIVVDPGSTDESRKIIKSYQKQIQKVIFESDRGPGDGLNNGFKNSTGDILGYINSDDLLLPGTLKTVKDYFENHPECDVISGHGYIINEYSEIIQKVFSNKLNNKIFSKKRFTIGYSILVQQATFFRRSLFDRVGGFDNSYRVMWDASLVVDFINNNASFHIINQPLASFRIYSQSITGSGTQVSEKGQLEFLRLQKKAGLKPIPKWQNQLLRFSGWLAEPKLLLLRLIDGIENPSRVI